MSFEAQVYLTWHNTRQLPAGSMYEMDVRMAMVLLALAADFNGGGKVAGMVGMTWRRA